MSLLSSRAVRLILSLGILAIGWALLKLTNQLMRDLMGCVIGFGMAFMLLLATQRPASSLRRLLGPLEGEGNRAQRRRGLAFSVSFLIMGLLHIMHSGGILPPFGLSEFWADTVDDAARLYCDFLLLFYMFYVFIFVKWRGLTTA